jgi:hypothetical protein
MPATYEPIETQTLGSDVATVTFSSIPQTYTDLVLVTNLKHSFAGSVAVRIDACLQFNSDTASNYSTTYMQGNGTSASSSRLSSQTGIAIISSMASATSFLPSTLNIFNYTNATTYKTVLIRGGNGDDTNYGASMFGGLWRATPAAITTIDFKATSTYVWKTGSTFTLYGIKAA